MFAGSIQFDTDAGIVHIAILIPLEDLHEAVIHARKVSDRYNLLSMLHGQWRVLKHCTINVSNSTIAERGKGIVYYHEQYTVKRRIEE